MKDKYFAYGFVAVAALLLVFAVYKTFLASDKDIPIDNTGIIPTRTLVPPTLSVEEKEIVAKIETKTVEISDTAVVPLSIIVKINDQIQFFNRTRGKIITVDGGSWGKVPLGEGENMTQAFKETGTYKYQVAPLGLSGEVVVQ